jgi:DNA-binding response OmpR family regulator
MKGRILIVDDEFGLAELLGELLVEEGYEASIAINGRLGLDILKAQPADLVILDVMMPVMSGPEMARAMKATSELAHIPIVMMTALPSALPADTPPLYDAVLRKPFRPEELYARMAELLPPLGTAGGSR